jgi:hypothetical protein
VNIENELIKQVDSKTLGVTIDQHLSWRTKTENICKKITSGISALRRLKEFADKQTLLSVYNAIVRTYFDYYCEVWDVFKETQPKRLQRLQNRAAQIIMNVSNDIDHSVALQADWVGSYQPRSQGFRVRTREETRKSQSRSPSLRSSGRNARLWDNPLPEARNPG